MWYFVDSTGAITTQPDHYSAGLYLASDIKTNGKLACFDLDWTLTGPTKAQTFTKTYDDVVLLPGRLDKLHQLADQDYTLVILTNQKITPKNSLEFILGKLNYAISLLTVPVILAVSFKEDVYRKPNPGLWQLVQQAIPEFKAAFYCGDAAGRPGDFSDSDKQLALNLGLDFKLPEEIFPTLTPADMTLAPTKNLIVMVGAAGTGKTTYCKTYLADYTWINQDTLKTMPKVLKTIEGTMQAEKNIVIDSTNPDLAKRQKYFDLAAKYNYVVTILYFARDGQVWNKLRPKPVPTIAYNIYYKKLVLPTTNNSPGQVYQIC